MSAESLVREYVRESLTELKHKDSGHRHQYPRILSFLQSPTNYLWSAIKRVFGVKPKRTGQYDAQQFGGRKMSMKDMSPQQREQVKTMRKLADRAKDAFMSGDREEAARLVKLLDDISVAK
jgi:hypothetical protein